MLPAYFTIKCCFLLLLLKILAFLLLNRKILLSFSKKFDLTKYFPPIRFFNHHIDDITAMDVHPNGQFVATGEVIKKLLTINREKGSLFVNRI